MLLDTELRKVSGVTTVSAAGPSVHAPIPDSMTSSIHQTTSVATGLTHVNGTVSVGSRPFLSSHQLQVHGNSQGPASLPHTPIHTGDVTTNLSELSEKLAVLSRQRDEENGSNQTTASGPDDLHVDTLNGLKQALQKVINPEAREPTPSHYPDSAGKLSPPVTVSDSHHHDEVCSPFDVPPVPACPHFVRSITPARFPALNPHNPCVL